MATIHDVAKLAGVAPITVSRVVNRVGYVRADTRARVEAAIQELQYIPNNSARSLRSKKTNTLALIVSDITNPFWTTVTRGVEDASSDHGLSVILCNTDEKQAKLENYVNIMLQKQIDGFLIVPITSNPQVVRRIQKRNVPVVVVDRYVDDVEVDTIWSDNEDGAYQLIKYLIQLGHKHIAMLSGIAEITTSQQRIAGYKRALAEHNLPQDKSLIIHGEFNHESGYQVTKQFMETAHPRPTALFCGNNLIAVGTFQALYELGLRVPEDISVVTFDDMPYSAAPPFVTVAAQSPYELGRQAAKLLIAQVSGKEQPGNRKIVLPVEIFIRKSCAVPNPDL